MVILALRWVGVGLRGVVVMGFGLNSGLMWNHPPPPPRTSLSKRQSLGQRSKRGHPKEGDPP